MKATIGEDSVLRIDMRIMFRASLTELANALCSAYRYHGVETDGPLPELSRAVTHKKIREEIHHRGASDGLGGWAAGPITSPRRRRVAGPHGPKGKSGRRSPAGGRGS